LLIQQGLGLFGSDNGQPTRIEQAGLDHLVLADRPGDLFETAG
jgi:hypothetical protein